MIDDRYGDFKTTVWDYYREHGRHDLPWRQLPADASAAYEVMVSELMLQQTQVTRVIPKYQQFLELFPTVQTLARASLGEVLRAWSGLGYNRRAKFLWQAAQMIDGDYQGQFPARAELLTKLPGVGSNTAGAILAYAFNHPAVFVETNIRTVFIHHFFHDQPLVADKAVLKLVAKTLDLEHPREWYWALMDYGAHLKQTVGNLNRQSRVYTRQSTFEGSRRQVRGRVIQILGSDPSSLESLQKQISDKRLPAVVDELLAEGLIQKTGTLYWL